MLKYARREKFNMKKILLALITLGLCITTASAYTYIQEKENVFYNPQNSTWSNSSQSENDIKLKHKSFIGSGGFTEYYYSNGKLAIGPETNIEFIHDGELIGINSQDLKFYKYIYKNNAFEKQLLTIDEIQELYPDYSIIRVSDFKNNEIKIYKKFMSKKKILLLNDTENSFYKYNYKPASVNPERIKPFIILSHAGKIVFSHYGEDTKEAPALKIFVVNEF